MTFNIILRHIFPENFIEFPQVVQKIWRNSLSIFFLKHGLTLWFVLFLIIFCLNSDFLFCNFLSIPSNTKLKWSFGANSREENTFLNLDYLAGPNTWIINVKCMPDFNQYVFWRPLNYQIFRRHKNDKKTSPFDVMFYLENL